MTSLTRTGALLLAVFAVFLLAFLAELSYLLWRLRRRRLSLPNLSSPSPDGKELLFYFLCCKNPSRVEPAGHVTAVPPEEAADEEEEDLAAKWQMGLLCGSYGPSRFLYTIKEEEREEVLSSADDNARAGDDLRLQIPADIDEGGAGGEEEGDNDPTPFSTPCASPPYYTPSPSPGREGASSPPDMDDVISGG